jgi:hypothetical protein
MFAMHQVIVFWVVIASAGILAASIFNVLQLFGWLNAKASFNWLFHGIDYFPAFTMLALALGWLLGRSLRDPSMFWVWTFPTLLLVHALVEIPTITPQLVSPAFQAGVGQSRFFHYFGWGCRLGNYCLDQSCFTRPFYAGVAYSLAALAAMKTFKPPPTTPGSRFGRHWWWVCSSSLVRFMTPSTRYVPPDGIGNSCRWRGRPQQWDCT